MKEATSCKHIYMTTRHASAHESPILASEAIFKERQCCTWRGAGNSRISRTLQLICTFPATGFVWSLLSSNHKHTRQSQCHQRDYVRLYGALGTTADSHTLQSALSEQFTTSTVSEASKARIRRSVQAWSRPSNRQSAELTPKCLRFYRKFEK